MEISQNSIVPSQYSSSNPLATSNSIYGMVQKRAITDSSENRKIFVGRIPPGLSDNFLYKLLETCGAISSWKRTVDGNGRFRNFGICEYGSTESVFKAIRLLNKLEVEEGYELLINVDIRTQDFLSEWREEKKEEWLAKCKKEGLAVDLKEIEEKEAKGEPLMWELEMMEKDFDTRRNIREVMMQKKEIEAYDNSHSRSLDLFRDLREKTGWLFN